jgi:glucosamine--fructose-6-phosphate aminotransferase (isomerizing)
VALATPSLFSLYSEPPRLEGALVVGISQSGQSPDIVSVLREGRKQGRPTLAITNAIDSPLASEADYVINIQAGVETAVAATKTYTAELMAIAMLSAAFDPDEERWEALAATPEWLAQALRLEEQVRVIAGRYRFMHQCVVLGRGYNYCTAFEWSLKLKELCYVLADPYSSADFLHGPIAMMERGFAVMAVAPGGFVYRSMVEVLERLRHEQLAELLVISDEVEALGLAQSSLALPQGVPEWLTPIVSITPAQLFSYYLAQEKGLNTEAPRGIVKVTETY